MGHAKFTVGTNGLIICATLKEVGRWLCFIDAIMSVIAGTNSTKHSFRNRVDKALSSQYLVAFRFIDNTFYGSDIHCLRVHTHTPIY